MSNLEEEMLKFNENLFKLTDDQHKEITKAYKGSLDNILEKVAQLYVKYGVDGKLTIAELHKYNRLVAFEKQIKEELKRLGGIELNQFNTMLKDIYTQSFYQTAFVLEMGTVAVINFALLKPEFVKEVIAFNWSGVPFSERIWSNQDAMLKGLRTELTQGIIQGDSVDKMARRFRGKFNSSYSNSQRLFRTESARVISSAQEKIYQESGVVQELIYTATLDSKTSERCRNLDGKRFKVGDPKTPKVPQHPNCRSCLIPAVRDYQPTKRKDNETKKVNEYKNYEKWAKAKNIKV